MPVGVNREDTEKVCLSPVDRLTESFDSFIKDNSLTETLEEMRREVYQSFCDKTQGNYFNGKTLGVNHIDGLLLDRRSIYYLRSLKSFIIK